MDICIKIFMVESEAKICMPLNYMTFFCKSEVKKIRHGMCGIVKESNLLKERSKAIDSCNECLILHGVLKDKAMSHLHGYSSGTI